MASTGVNVLRWSALGAGLFYGVYHQSTIKAADKLAASRAEYERKEHLIEQAKAAYVKKTQPQDKIGSDLITDPEHPKFDLEKYVAAKVEA